MRCYLYLRNISFLPTCSLGTCTCVDSFERSYVLLGSQRDVVRSCGLWVGLSNICCTSRLIPELFFVVDQSEQEYINPTELQLRC